MNEHGYSNNAILHEFFVHRMLVIKTENSKVKQNFEIPYQVLRLINFISALKKEKNISWYPSKLDGKINILQHKS